MLCDDYVLLIADDTSVSTFLCTRKLGPKEVSLCTEIALWCYHSVIMPETQQPIIVIILIIYSSYFLEVLVEL